jgi:hypothetical protein
VEQADPVDKVGMADREARATPAIPSSARASRPTFGR